MHRSKANFELLTSQLIYNVRILTDTTVATGDPPAAGERSNLLVDIPLLDAQHSDVSILADALVAKHLLPEKAAAECSPCGRVNRLWRRIPIDVELQTHRKC